MVPCCHWAAPLRHGIAQAIRSVARILGLAALGAPLLIGEASAAAYATGGTSIYRDQVLWLTWGGGVNGAAGVALNNTSTTSVSIPVAAGQTMNITCSLSNADGKSLTSYRPGTWTGDTFDNLYNIGGTGAANQLIAGIARAGGQVTFTVNCSATLGGSPYNLRGLVVADAEAINTGTEYVQATAKGSWTVVELQKNLSAGAYMAAKSQDGAGNQTIRFGPGNDNNTAAISFLTFDTPAANVSMDFDIRGGGTTAIAIGLLAPYADFGDAPASYGEAMHVIADLNFRPDGIAIGSTVNLNTAGYQSGALLPPGLNYIGSQGPDSEAFTRFSADALGDDNSPLIDPREEDGWGAGTTLSVLDSGQIITHDVLCAGAGTVAGWLDLDRSGAFDASEKSAAVCAAGTAGLSWTMPAALTVGPLFAHLRYSLDASEVAGPVGVATSGEVEDHMLMVRSPSLNITKASNAIAGSWAVNEPAASYRLTVTNNGLEPTGRLPAIPAAPITVLDKLPAGVEPKWTGTHVSNGWSCTFLGVDISCVTSQVLAPGGSSTITLPVNIPETVPAGPMINFASVGGGYDPHNNGVPPVPGAVCADAAHCASHTVTIDATPGLSLVKNGVLNDLNGNALIDLGETIRYDFIVTNTGRVTLTNVSVADAMLSGAVPPVAITPGPQTLAPGATTTFSALYTPVQADIDAGTVTNNATASGTPPFGPPTTTPPATVTVPPNLTPGLKIVKTGLLNDVNGNDKIDVGESITYTFVVTNIGLVTLNSVNVSDPMLSGAVPPVAITTPDPTTLAPTEFATFAATYTPTQAQIDSGSVTNTATAKGTPPGLPEITSPPDTVTVPPNVTPGLSIVKTGLLDDLNGNGLINLGETIRYSFQVVNTGGVTLTDVTVVDPLVTIIESPQTLEPGGTYRFTAIYTAVQADIDAGYVENTATATGTPPAGPPVDSPPDTVIVPSNMQPSLLVQKTALLTDTNGNGLSETGEGITYEFRVTNNGAVTLTNVLPRDAGPRFGGVPGANALSAFTPGPATLAPGGVQVFSASYEMAQSDIDNAARAGNQVENIADATAIGPNGRPVVAPLSLATLPVLPPAAITLTKQAGRSQVWRGEIIPFTIVLANSAPTNAGLVDIVDTIPSGFSFVDGSATVDGVPTTPSLAGSEIRFAGQPLGPTSQLEIRLSLLALATASPGRQVNRVNVLDPTGTPLVPEAIAMFEVLAEAMLDCSEIVGKVFDDLDRDGYQDQGEPGLPGVRLATVRGVLITTDAHGRFSIPCAAMPNSEIGSNFVLKLDTRTLPTGYGLTTDNPAIVRLTAGKMSDVNFGASIGRQVRLDLNAAAFLPGTDDLHPELVTALDGVIGLLEEEERTTLVLTYGDGPDALQAGLLRLDAVESHIRDLWRRVGAPYELVITRQTTGNQGGQQ